MKTMRSLLYFTVVCISSVFLNAQEVQITDFRIPESRFSRLNLHMDGDLGGNWGGSTNGWENTWDSYRYATTLEHSHSYNSESNRYSVFATLNGVKQFSKNSSTSPTSVSKYSYDAETSLLTMNMKYASYLVPDAWFIAGKVHGYAQYNLGKDFNESNGSAPQNHFRKTTNYNGTAGIGIGYGNVRNARSVIAILRIMENLTDDGFLTRRLSREETVDLVEKYEAELTNSNQYDRPVKHIAKMIFAELIAKGVITSDAAIAFAVERSAEVLTEQIYSREFGWTIQTGPEVIHTEQLMESDNNSDLYSKRTSDNWIIEGEYGYPFSLTLHWYSSAVVKLPVLGPQKRVGYEFNSSLYYEIGEKISTVAGLSYRRGISYEYFQLTNNTEYLSDSFFTSLQFNYFLEDNIFVSVQGMYSDNLYIFEQQLKRYRQTQGNYQVIFGLNYRIF
jgi:hypothetical protein